MEQKVEAAWTKNVDWKARYSKLYSSGYISKSEKEQPSRISFMSNESSPYASLLMRVRSSRPSSVDSEAPLSPLDIGTTILSEQSETYSSPDLSYKTNDLGGHETKLLDMVRASRDLKDELTARPLNIPRDDESDDDSTSEACVHVLSMRATERSVSRSRFSRMSTRRDMDIPSILAFSTSTTFPTQFQIPAFQKTKQTEPQQDVPRWSIRRSVCPVCSQKWKDRSALRNVKYSGLKRNSAQELPSVIAPGRLRASITMAYVPRPALPVVDEDSAGFVVKRNTSATWKLTRARRFRAPKLLLPPHKRVFE